MLRWTVGSCLRFRLLVVPLAAALMLFGILQLRAAPVDVLPEFRLPVVEVQTESLGLSAPEVEQLITVPMEQDLLNGVMGVEEIRSNSVPGLSDITMVFERGTDVMQARQLVQERLTQAHALPNVSKPPQMLQPMSSTSRAMIVGLSSDRLSPIQLSVLARWTIKPRLMGLAGVANVAIWGYRDRELEVAVDPRRLAARRVSLSQVVRTTGNAQLVSPLTFVEASTPGTGGFVDGANQRLGVRHIVPLGTPRNLAQVPVEGAGRSVRLGDVASVSEQHPPLIGDAVVGGRPGLLLVVQKLPGADTVDVTRKVQDALDQLRPGLPGVRIDAQVFRQATFIEDAAHNVALMSALGGVFALVALLAFFLSWRPVLVIALTVALALIVAVLVLRLAGATLNALVLAGLLVALAAVIDDAIADVEHVARRLRRRRAAGERAKATRAVLEATLQMRRPAGYATAVLLLAILPVFFAGGTSGAFVHSLALGYALAVLASMIVAATVAPVLGLLLCSRPPRREPVLATRLQRTWRRMLSSALRSPRPAILAFTAMVVIALVALPFVHETLRPAFKDRDVAVRWNALPGTALPEMTRITTRAVRELERLPGVENAAAHIGRAVTGDEPVGSGSGELWVRLAAGADYDATLRAVRNVVSGYAGVSSRVLTYESDRTQGVLTPAAHELVVRVSGTDYHVLRREAERVRAVVAPIAGVQAPHVVAPAQEPALRVETRLAAARRHGLKPGDVRRAAGTLVNGLEVGSFFERQKVFLVVVRGVPATRESITSIRDLPIDTPGGGHVRLGDVASVKLTPTPVDIRHQGVERYVDVRAAVQGRGLDAVQSEATRRLRRMSLPLEYSAEVVRPSEDVRAPAGRLLSLAVAAIAGIFLLLQAAFGSWRLAALVFAALPLALVGGLLVIAAGGGDLSLGAALGLLAVGGLAVRNAIVLVMRLEELAGREGGRVTSALVERGVADRVAPVATTAVVVALVMAPFALAGDVAGNEITHDLAAVVLGGLVSSTLLNLFLIPALYLHAGRTRPRPAKVPVPSAPASPVAPSGVER